MIRTVVTIVVLALATTAAAAPPHKVLVLPLEGTTDPSVRAKLDDQVRELAKSIDGQVTPGTTTFTETATAVGCDPATPKCVDEVLVALSVDEVVWGTADTTAGKTTVVLHRASRSTAAKPSTPTEGTASVDAGAPIESVAGQLHPLFGLPPEPVTPPPGPVAPEPATNSRHTLMIAMTAGGGFLVLVGLILWGNEASVQSDIDSHPTRTLADFRDLTSLEGRASGYAITGDLLLLGGLALAGYGGWQLYKDHEQSVTVRPTPMPGGAGVTLEWRGLP